ncbi:MAG: methyltransferase domain-containing protein [Rhodospirillaceae bacterium]|nr:methyltransferase domain-containing protein [Rhodospirillaceae bacterium]
MATWDPAQYARFAEARLRPAIDLLARVPAGERRLVCDLGCGAGQVTRLLAERHPGAEIIGVDSSAAMLERARAAVPAARFLAADIAVWSPPRAADLIVANAALHWIEGHDALMLRLLGGLAPRGVLAVQMPRNHAAPSHTAIAETAASGPWAARLAGVRGTAPVAAAAAYARRLLPHAAAGGAWESEYVHVLAGPDPVMEWTKGATLRPYLDALGADAPAFLAEYAARLRRAYPPLADGRTLFPFRRVFVVAVAR